LTCALVQWLQVYNKRATGFIAQLLGATQLGSVPRKCLTLVTPAGIYVRTIPIEKTTTVADITNQKDHLYWTGDYSSPLTSTLRLWDRVEDGDQLTLTMRVFEGIVDFHGTILYYGIQSISWHPNRKWVAYGVPERIYIWDIYAAKTIRILDGHIDTVHTLSWHPSGKWLASGSKDNTIRIWNTKTWKGECFNNCYFSSVCWHPSGEWLIGANRQSIEFLDISTWTYIKTIRLCVWGPISFHPTKNQFADTAGNMIRIWNIEPLKCIRVLTHRPSRITSICWHPSGNWLASGSDDMTVQIWDIIGQNEPHIIQDDIHRIDINWNQTGTQLVGVARNGALIIWK